MSMISAQCDELRQMAESVGLAMPQVATLMMEAADTIWELRGSVHREQAENVTLRQQLADVTESMGRVEERCAKLRELVRAAWKGVPAGLSCSDCRLIAGGCTLQSAMRELGADA